MRTEFWWANIYDDVVEPLAVRLREDGSIEDHPGAWPRRPLRVVQGPTPEPLGRTAGAGVWDTHGGGGAEGAFDLADATGAPCPPAWIGTPGWPLDVVGGDARTCATVQHCDPAG